MPRHAKGIRLWLRKERRDAAGRVRPAKWFIRDGDKQVGTGCGRDDRKGAEKALADYLAARYRPDTGQRDPDQLQVNDVLAVYGAEVAPTVASPERIGTALEPLATFWAGKLVGEIRGATCREYVAWRTSQRWVQATKRTDLFISVGTARRELECLQAAVRYYAKEYKLNALPMVTLPPKPEAAERWLTRAEAADFLRAAHRDPRKKHLVRFFLIGLYTGTRHAAILKLKWMPSTDGGWVDLEAGLIYRRGTHERKTKKRQPTSRIPPRLLFWLRRWKAEDDRANKKREAKKLPPCLHIVSWAGRPIAKERRAWNEAREEAGLGEDVTPHTLRHTSATWLMQRGARIWDAADYLGMDATMLERVYGHHHPDYQSDIGAKFSGRA
jgi:integrase